MLYKNTVLITLTISLLIACSNDNPSTQNSAVNNSAETETSMSNISTENPFLSPSPLVFQFPQFDLISPEHYLPAFEQGMAEQLAEIEAIIS